MALAYPLVQRSFAAGEIAPAYAARADLDAYRAAGRTVRNFLIQRSGGVTNRPGTRYLGETKSASEQARLLKFIAPGASYVIEAGSGYFRFWKAGARVATGSVAAWSNATAYGVGDLAASGGVSYYCVLAHTNHAPPNATYWYALPGTIYEVPTPYTGAFDLLRATQQATTVTITHQDYPPQDLTLTAVDRFTLTPVTTAPAIAPPSAGLTGTAGGAGARTFQYVITAVAQDTYEESIASAPIVIASAAAPTPAAPHALAWTAVAGAAEYRVYGDPYANQTYGYLATVTNATACQDVGFVPDFNLTPPLARALFASANTYPACCTYYQQRRVFASSHTAVARVWASRIGFARNFAIRSPLQDDDAVTFDLVGRQGSGNDVQHLIGLKRLIVLTASGEWIVYGGDDGVLTPTTLHPEQEGFSGASAYATPVVLGDTVIFVQGLNRIVRDLRISPEGGRFQSRDLTVLAAHLFEQTVSRIDFANVPHSIVWVLRLDGVLLGLTYLPEYDVFGWSRHDTAHDSLFVDVAVLPEGDEDAVYVLVRRTIAGAQKYYLERFASRRITTYNTDAHFVDSGVVYSGSATTAISGLAHLEGAEVIALADGVVRGPFTVASGAITLPVAATTVHVGLRIESELETLDLDVATTPALRAVKKKVVAVDLLLERSARGLKVGPDAAHLETLVAQQWDPAAPFTGTVEIATPGTFTKEGRVFLRHTDPTPLTVLAVLPHVDVGG